MNFKDFSGLFSEKNWPQHEICGLLEVKESLRSSAFFKDVRIYEQQYFHPVWRRKTAGACQAADGFTPMTDRASAGTSEDIFHSKYGVKVLLFIKETFPFSGFFQNHV